MPGERIMTSSHDSAAWSMNAVATVAMIACQHVVSNCDRIAGGDRKIK